MLKIKREKGTRRCFLEVSKSHHSPLILVGAPAQGCSSPLIRARIKCSLRVGFFDTPSRQITQSRSQLESGHPQSLRMITELPITTKPSR